MRSPANVVDVSVSISKRSLAARLGRPYDKGRGVLWQALWVAVQSTVFTRVWCPNGARIAILRAFGAQLGDGVLVRHRVRIQWPWKLTIGHNSWVGTDVDLYNLDHITLGNDVVISQHAYVCTGSHDRHSPTFEFDNAPIVLEDGVWLCARSTVLRGVTVGANSTVAATALVTRDVPPDSIVLPPPSEIVRS
ncbi:MAG: colanic acid biosynthesis acetyltransferase [Mycobacterium sp.]|nr:colanic acid biosynthesis acetyltransferase [Mycobacterium sp.]